jgi:hypothetical protein
MLRQTKNGLKVAEHWASAPRFRSAHSSLNTECSATSRFLVPGSAPIGADLSEGQITSDAPRSGSPERHLAEQFILLFGECVATSKVFFPRSEHGQFRGFRRKGKACATSSP